MIHLIWFMLPAYAANLIPVLVSNLPILDAPVDFGKKIGRYRIFGAHKTWRGIVCGILAGTGLFWLQKMIGWASLIDYSQPVLFGFMLSLGALSGDLAKSFFKRRMGIKPGKSWFPFDQIDYSVGALVFVSPWFFAGWLNSLAIVLVGGGLHISVNMLGYLLGMRKSWI